MERAQQRAVEAARTGAEVSALRCDHCGRFIADADFRDGRAFQVQITPDSAVSHESWETAHEDCCPCPVVQASLAEPK